MEIEVWIGLVGVKPGEGQNILEKDNGGFVNILLIANSFDDYKNKVIRFLYENNLKLQELDDVENFSIRMEHYEVEEKLIQLAEIVKETGTPQFGTIHTY